MKKIKLYIAISLDGKIARPDGDVSWLEQVPNPDNNDYRYTSFYNSIDTTVMGNNTYKMIKSFGGDFPYPDKENYVITRDKSLKDDNNVKYLSEDIEFYINSLKNRSGKDIWLIGGGEVNKLLMDLGLVDELIVFVMPIILGEGLPLFGEKLKGVNLDMIRSKKYHSGVVELNYNVIKR